MAGGLWRGGTGHLVAVSQPSLFQCVVLQFARQTMWVFRDKAQERVSEKRIVRYFLVYADKRKAAGSVSYFSCWRRVCISAQRRADKKARAL